MPKSITVYLSGPMYLGKEQATGWRDEIKEQILRWQQSPANHTFIHFNVLDPCNRWYDKGVQLDDVGGYVVQMDKMEIMSSDVLIVNATNPGWGTPMEQYLAWAAGKMIFAFSDCDFPSIWAKAHSHQFFRTHTEATAFLCSVANQIVRAV